MNEEIVSLKEMAENSMQMWISCLLRINRLGYTTQINSNHTLHIRKVEDGVTVEEYGEQVKPENGSMITKN